MLCTADLTVETEDPPMIERLGHRLGFSIHSFLTALIAIYGALVKVPTDLCGLENNIPWEKSAIPLRRANHLRNALLDLRHCNTY